MSLCSFFLLLIHALLINYFYSANPPIDQYESSIMIPQIQEASFFIKSPFLILTPVSILDNLIFSLSNLFLIGILENEIQTSIEY